ncbi:MAG: ATP-dependent helicase RecG [Verrucomicrobiales bacterium]|nr:ATP-dependent helicase RecG [Verrucomicrobiales bacterium]
MPVRPPLTLDSPVTALPGVGPDRASQLERLGIHFVSQLLLHRPRRYEDRKNLCKVRDLEKGMTTVVQGTIVACGLKTWSHKTKSVYEFILDDGSGRLHCRWWNLPFMEKYFKTGDSLLVYGKVLNLKPATIDHPETEFAENLDDAAIHLGRIVPIYPLTEGLGQRWLRALIFRTMVACKELVHEEFPQIVNPPSRASALELLHSPTTLDDPEKARQKLSFDEFVSLQFRIQARRKKLEEKAQALPCQGDNRLIKIFLQQLPYKLTDGQKTVLKEIRADLGGKVPMRRLLQGDVGSGKTVVAACASLMTIESGFNVAIMAPTEILAEQHFRNFHQWFNPLHVSVELRTSSRKVSTLFDQGQLRVTIGTHALLEDNVNLQNLGLVIIDEQHKFGVVQRDRFLGKGNYPHLMVMTATPIPRTLGLTLYGDLDVSRMEGMPGGRTPIRTFIRPAAKAIKVWEFVKEQVKKGRQAYVVYPRIEEDPRGLKSVKKETDLLRTRLAPYRVEALHGRMESFEKEAVMKEFGNGSINILVATSIIEVGVDISNATVMVIEDANLFGLAQLHQLRGRIGRGSEESYCIVLTRDGAAESTEKLKVFEKTLDGFQLAEEDMKLRGVGNLVGSDQSGLPDFKFGDFNKDGLLIEKARLLVRENLNLK